MLPNLTVQQLEYLVAAVDHTTHGDAASSLGVTPSALSQGLAELGRKLGIDLFDRVGRRVMFRDEAEPVLAHARLVVAQTTDLARYTRALGEGSTGRVRVGMIDVAALHHLAPALHDIRQDLPDIDLHLVVAPSSQLLVQLASGSLDLVVAVKPSGHPDDLDVVDVLDEPLFVYSGHAGPAGVDPNDPKTWNPWVGFPAASHSRLAVTSALRTMGATYEVVAESNQPDVLKEMASLGLGLVALPAVQAETDPRPLRRLVEPPLTHRTLSVVRRRSAHPSQAAAELHARLTRRQPSPTCDSPCPNPRRERQAPEP